MADVYDALEAFPHYHNVERVHMGRACGGQIPDEAFPRLPSLPQLPDQVNPNRWLEVEHGRVFRRRVRANGTIQVDKHTYYIGTEFAKQAALVSLNGFIPCFYVRVNGRLLDKTIPIKDLYPEQLDLQDYMVQIEQEAISIARYRQMVWQKSGDAA